MQAHALSGPGNPIPSASRFAAAVLLAAAMFLTGCPTDGTDGADGDGGSTTCEQGTTGGTATVSFAADVQPILSSAGCLTAGCHGGTINSSGYRLATYESMFAPGDEAQELGLCPIVPGDPDGSYLIEKLRPSPQRGARMPLLRTPLGEEQLETIATWIREGAQNN
ncbi:MAG: hypothetical protein HRF50_02560 [Phycisphaerae bacterium]|jgi:hypothetical protein